VTSRLRIIECLIQDSTAVIDPERMADSKCRTIAYISHGYTVFAPSQVLITLTCCDHFSLIVNKIAIPNHRMSSGTGTNRIPKHTLAVPLVAEKHIKSGYPSTMPAEQGSR
jgi:hypothetical protein